MREPPGNLWVLSNIVKLFSDRDIVWFIESQLLQNLFYFVVRNLILFKIVDSYQLLHLEVFSKLFVVKPEFYNGQNSYETQRNYLKVWNKNLYVGDRISQVDDRINNSENASDITEEYQVCQIILQDKIPLSNRVYHDYTVTKYHKEVHS